MKALFSCRLDKKIKNEIIELVSNTPGANTSAFGEYLIKKGIAAHREEEEKKARKILKKAS